MLHFFKLCLFMADIWCGSYMICQTTMNTLKWMLTILQLLLVLIFFGLRMRQCKLNDALINCIPVQYRHGLVGETALYTRIAEAYIRHPSYFFGDAPALPNDLAVSPDIKEQPSLSSVNESDTTDKSTPDKNEGFDFESVNTEGGNPEHNGNYWWRHVHVCNCYGSLEPVQNKPQDLRFNNEERSVKETSRRIMFTLT